METYSFGLIKSDFSGRSSAVSSIIPSFAKASIRLLIRSSCVMLATSFRLMIQVYTNARNLTIIFSCKFSARLQKVRDKFRH